MTDLHEVATFLAARFPEVSGDDENASCSRRLARLALDLALPGSTPSGLGRFIEVCDGRDDDGIDAVALDEGEGLIVLVQSKWSLVPEQKTLKQAECRKFADGVRRVSCIDEQMLPTCSPTMRERVARLLESESSPRIRLVLAVASYLQIQPAIDQPIRDVLGSFNDSMSPDIATYKSLNLSEILEGVRALARPRPKAPTLSFHGRDFRGLTGGSRKATTGQVRAIEIARWYAAYGTGLFRDNLRIGKSSSDINRGIYETATKRPEDFWYLNNGLTIVASACEAGVESDDNVRRVTIVEASIVNGAQTVSTLGRALQHGHSDVLERALVSVKVVVVPEDQPELARDVTRYANTQNEVQDVDFLVLRPEQQTLADGLASLGYKYQLRRGEVLDSNTRTTISAWQVVTAMACAANLRMAALAKRERSALLEGRPYNDLFGEPLSPVRVLRAVLALQVIDDALLPARAVTGLRGAVAAHGDRLIAYVLLRALDDHLDEASFGRWIATLPNETRNLQRALEQALPSHGTYAGTIFKNPARCAGLLEGIGIEVPHEELEEDPAQIRLPL